MFYIHKTSCISPQQTFQTVDLHQLNDAANRRFLAVEPSYYSIPPGVLRRMGKAVRMGVGAALPLLQDIHQPDGIIIGTANGGKEDCVKFLKQVVQYEEGMVTPVNFVQSTPNAVAAQIGLLTKNHGYNISHLHLGLAFEFAMIDVDMLLGENPSNSYLLGAVDDISTYNYFFEEKDGWYKAEEILAKELYQSGTAGSIAGEGAAMFWANGNKTHALASVVAVDTLHSSDEILVKQKVHTLIEKYLPAGEKIDLLISGENGDNRLLKYYTSIESVTGYITVARFKHLCGEYPTAAAIGLWLSCEIFNKQSVPEHLIKRLVPYTKFKNILIYNTYKGIQHSAVLVSLM